MMTRRQALTTAVGAAAAAAVGIPAVAAEPVIQEIDVRGFSVHSHTDDYAVTMWWEGNRRYTQITNVRTGEIFSRSSTIWTDMSAASIQNVYQ